MIRTLLTLTALQIYVSALYTLFTQVNTPIANSYGGHLQFLTVIGVYASAISQAFALVTQLTGLRTAAWLEDLALKISAPLEVIISLLYWPLKLTHPTLLLDPKVNVVLDPILDKKLHLYPALFQVIYAVVYPSKLWNARGVLEPSVLFGVFAGAYYAWAHHVSSINGRWPYPLLGLLSDQQRIGMFVGCASAGVAVYKTIQWAQHRKSL